MIGVENRETKTRSSEKTEWDSLSESRFVQNPRVFDKIRSFGSREKVKTPEQMNRERQERKFLAQVMRPESAAIAMPDIEMSEEQRRAGLEIIASDEFGQAEADEILENIATPVDRYGAEMIFDSFFAGDKEMRMMLNVVNGDLDKKQLDDCSAESVKRFESRFASPAALEARMNEYMDYCEAKKAYGDEKQKDTAEKWIALFGEKSATFKKVLYGKREDYYQVYKGLQREAAEQKKDERPFELYSHEESMEMLKTSECEGDPVPTREGGWKLTPDALLNANLEPRFKVEIDGTEIGLSGTFDIGGGRDAAIGYVKCPDGKIMQRSYYRSNSQGVWRLLPDYVLSFHPRDKWYSKGYSEEMMIVPSKMQAALCAITEQGPTDTGGINGEQLFFGTAKHYSSKDEWGAACRAGKLRSSVYKEVSPRASMALDGRGAISSNKRQPEKLRMVGGYLAQPNFDDETRQFTTPTGVYGEMTVDCVRSADKKLMYLFNHATVEYPDGQSEKVVWLGGIETDSPITSGGIRRDWVAAGDIATPPLEYASQDGGFGDKTKRFGSYVSMWRGYVSKIPLIRRYCKYQMNKVAGRK